MRLDRNLTSQQLWTIAADREHRTADLLDQIVDHPATYRALSDWAVAALGESDVRAVDDPPAPGPETTTPRRGLRLPAMPLARRSVETPASEQPSEPAPAPEASGIDAWLTAGPVVDPAPAQDRRATQRVRVARSDQPRQAEGAQHAVTNWLRRPAPVGLVIVLAVVEVLTLLALAVVARQEPAPAPAAPAVTSPATATVTESATVQEPPESTATKGENK